MDEIAEGVGDKADHRGDGSRYHQNGRDINAPLCGDHVIVLAVGGPCQHHQAHHKAYRDIFQIQSL